MDQQRGLFDGPSPAIADQTAPARHSHPATSAEAAPDGERRIARKLQAALGVYYHAGQTSAEIAVKRNVDRVEMARWLPDARRDKLVDNGPYASKPITKPCTVAKRRADGSQPRAICWFLTAAGLAALQDAGLIPEKKREV